MSMRGHTSCGAVILAVLVALPAGASRDDEPDSRVLVADNAGHDHDAHDAAPAAGVGGAWSALVTARDGIAASVDEGRLEDVHAQAEHLAPLANALLERSTDLAPDKRARVEGVVKQMPRLADALHDAADAGKTDETRRQLKRLDGVLVVIRVQYPAGTFSASGSPSQGTGGEAATGHGGEGHDMSTHEHMGVHAHRMRPLAAVDAPATAKLRVAAGEFKFEPRSLEMRVGQPTRIELENDGAVEHALIVKAPDGQADWIHLHAAAKGTDAGTYQIDQPGRYRLLCTIPGHTEAGMVGELLVR